MPKYYLIPFGSSGDKTAVPNASQVDGTVNYTDGYGEDYSLPLDSDPSALAPERDKWNQLWYDITTNMQQYQQHGIPEFITTSDNGGSPYSYDVGALVRNGGVNYICTSAANTNTPPGVGWVVFDGVNITGNAATATALATGRTIGGVTFDGTANIVPQTIQTVDDAADTTCFLAFFNASGTQTGGQQPKTNSGLTYNASTNVLTATTFVGALTGNASSATLASTVTVADAAGDTTTFVMLAGSATGSLPVLTDSGLTYNATSNALTATTFVGALSGNADTATLAATVTVADASGDTTMFPMLAGSATGSLPVLTDPGLSYNATTNALTATTFIGALTGNADTATSATSATNATNATNIGVTDAGGDTTTWVLLAGSQTGTQGALTDGGLTYQATTNALTATTFIGALTGNASTATALATARNIGAVSFDGTADIVPTNIQPAAENSDTTCFLAFFNAASGTSQQPKYNSSLGYNASTNALTATTFVGALSGNATTATALATPRTIGGVSFDGSANIVPQTIQSVNEASDTTCFVLFISASGSQSLQPLNNTALTFNASTGQLGATSYTGALASAVTATTQSQRDNSTKVATTAYVDLEAGGVPINSQSVNYTTVLTDAGKCMYQTGASKTFTIDSNANVAYPVNTVLMFETNAAAGVDIAITSDSLFSTLGSGTRHLAQYGQAFAHKVASTTWIINGSGLT